MKTVRMLFFLIVCVLTVSCNDYATAADILQAEDNKLAAAADLVNKHSFRKAEAILLDLSGNSGNEKGMAHFLLGRLYREEGSPEKSEVFFAQAAEEYPLLRDYALKYLIDIYRTTGRHEKVVGTSRKVKNNLLLHVARQSEIDALISLNRKGEAVELLSQYVEDYPSDWDYKLAFAMHLKGRGEVTRAVRVLKDIYINAVPPSNSALDELKKLKEDSFAKDELLTRAGNLFEKNNFQRAETEYQEILKLTQDAAEKDRVRFAVSMCQFRTKQYGKSSRTFGTISTPEALYYQGWSFHRMDHRAEFENIKKEFKARYPDDDRLALLLLMDGDAFRSSGDFLGAEKSYKEVISKFPSKSEDALWGMAWMKYGSGSYGEALDYFTQLGKLEKSDNYYKYLYWKARSSEKAVKECRKQQAPILSQDRALCEGGEKDFFSSLPFDRSFYGYLIRMRSLSEVLPDRIDLPKPVKPEGEQFDRIEALALAGLKEEAVNEILDALKRNNNNFKYLGYRAMELGEYKRIIGLTEKETDREFLPYSYPFGFGNFIEEAASPRSVDKYLIAALIREESRFDPQALSWAGARGLMQLMPATAYGLKKELKLSLRDRSEINDARKNILMGTHYLSGLLKEYKEAPLAIAAYNAGEIALKKWMAKYGTDDIVEFIENIPYKETRFYVKRVLKSYWRYRTINGLPVDGYQVFAEGRR